MAGRFYAPEELEGARVYDSEGLLYGLFDGILVRGGEVYLRVAVVVRARQPVVDVERLVAMLRGRGVDAGEGEPLEYLVFRAREEGLDIPYRVAEREVKLLKALVPVGEVAVVDVKKLYRDGVEKVEKVVLLRTPREAAYRGRRVAEGRPPVPEPGELVGRLVVSLREGVLGYAEGVVVGAGEPGLRVSRGRGVAGYINWIAFMNALRRLGYSELYERLAEYRDPLASPRLDISALGQVEKLLQEVGAPERVRRLLHEHTVRQPLPGSYLDVPWSRVLKINDIIIVE